MRNHSAPPRRLPVDMNNTRPKQKTRTSSAPRRNQSAPPKRLPVVMNDTRVQQKRKQQQHSQSSPPPPQRQQSYAAGRLEDYIDRSERAHRAENEYAKQIVPALASRAYHIPGNSCKQDYLQYFGNNHPVFGICCHNKLHPIGFGKRIVVLIGSIASGLAITNLVYLWFLLESDDGIDAEFISIGLQANITLGDLAADVQAVRVTNYQVFLWTVGSAVHSAFDLSIWYISACACCHPGGFLQHLDRFRWMGSYIVFFTVIVVAAAASLAVVLRATLNEEEDLNLRNITGGGALFDENIDLAEPESFRFLITYAIQMSLSLFAWNFIVGTIFFSGILGCYRLPFLGGRPYEMRCEERANERALRQAPSTDYSTDDLA